MLPRFQFTGSHFIPHVRLWSKGDELDVAALHRLFEVARPKALTGDPLQSALTSLYEFSLPHLERIFKRPDGARILQLVFRRGDPFLRARVLADLTPHLWAIATTQYSYHILLSVIRAIADVETLGLYPDGSRLIVALMGTAKGTEVFGEFVDAVFAEGHFVSPALHKLVKLVAAGGLVDGAFVRAGLERVGLENLLRSPGAWIVAELVKQEVEFGDQVRALIRAEGITGKAIEAILNPRSDIEFNRRKPFRKGRK